MKYFKILKITTVLLFFVASILFLAACENSTGYTFTGIKIQAKDSTDSINYFSKGIGNILIDSSDAYNYKNIFESKIRRFPIGIINDKVSQSVWFSKEAIIYLAKYLDSSNLNLDGVRIHFMAYDTLGSAQGQYKKNQVSLVFVPTNPNPNNPLKHIDNWQVLKSEYIKMKELFDMKKLDGGLNHGSLCPNDCQ